MAEFVNQRMEDMLTELEQMKRIGLYTEDEIKMISKKRKDFEYKIRKHVRCKEDYLKYISYECILLQNIRLRREQYSIVDKKSDIEYTISKRVVQLYNDLTTRFFDDIEIWLNYIEFCKNVHFNSMVTTSLDKLTQIHGEKPKIWALACRWEYEEMLNIKNAQKFILKGLQRHPDSADLYIDALRIELLIAENIKDDASREKQMERIQIILDSALKVLNTAESIATLIETFYDFEFTSDIRTQLFTRLWDEHKHESATWNFIADCEFQEKQVTGFDWTTLTDNFMSSQYPDNLNRFIAVHETSIHVIEAKNSILNFINGATNLIENNDLNDIHKIQVVNHALEIGHKHKLLDEEHYKLWMDILCSEVNKNQSEISKILEDACKLLPSSEFIWMQRLKMNIADPKESFALFNKAKITLPADKQSSVWNFMVENTTDVVTLEKMCEETMSLSPNVAAVVKPTLLRAFHKIGGISLARSIYKSMAISPPFSLELHQAMIDLENSKILDLKNIKYIHELSTQQYGKSNPDVWVRYVEFLLQHDPKNCTLLYNRACSTLKSESLKMFINKYTELINKN